ncbi:MAG: acyl-CoA/acyl-ACP dehydrogenase [Dehalococcoidia bacterium]|nr:acyl-CoA/acyl-ACP dehydrogenase [Dehalococcoidia bacterium]
MDFEFSEEQEMLRRSVRDFLEKECPRTLVRDIENNRLDYSAGLYEKMAGLGWLGLMISEEYGGTGGDWVDTAIFYEEAGRALLQSPHHSTVVLAGQSILAFGSAKQRRDLLPQITQGGLICAFALTEPEPGPGLSSLATTAATDGKGYVISGTKLFIGYAHIADNIITVARNASGETIMLFLVNREDPGLNCTPFATMSGDRLNEVVLDKVKVSKGAMLGEVAEGEAVEDIVDKAKVMTCAEALGGAQMALEMLVDYSKQRIIFGHPIGAFQALQHKMSDIALAIESARWLVYSAAWMSSHEIPCAKERAMAQLYTGQICPRITEEVSHCHGAVALVQDHDMTLYYRRAKATQLNLGFSESYDEIIAREIGL